MTSCVVGSLTVVIEIDLMCFVFYEKNREFRNKMNWVVNNWGSY